MTLEEKLLTNERLGGKRRFQTIDYRGMISAILAKHLAEFMAETGITKGLLGLYLRCSESFVDSMVEGYVPTALWLSGASSEIKRIVKT